MTPPAHSTAGGDPATRVAPRPETAGPGQDPRWLDTLEQQAWRGFIELSSRVRVALERQLRSEQNLTLDDYEVLVRLSEADGRRLRMSELATQVTHSPSRLSQRIDRLARDGLVERQQATDDRRGFFAVLTPDGLARLERAAPAHVEEVRRVFIDRLEPGEIDALARLLPRLAEQRQWEAES